MPPPLLTRGFCLIIYTVDPDKVYISAESYSSPSADSDSGFSHFWSWDCFPAFPGYWTWISVEVVDVAGITIAHINAIESTGWSN